MTKALDGSENEDILHPDNHLCNLALTQRIVGNSGLLLNHRCILENYLKEDFEGLRRVQQSFGTIP